MVATIPDIHGFRRGDHGRHHDSWRVIWELSDGRSGTEPDLFVSATIPYEVREIQTVGVEPDRP